MKKSLFLFLLWAPLFPFPAAAQAPPSDPAAMTATPTPSAHDEKSYFLFMAGVDLPGRYWQPGYPAGFGGRFALDHEFEGGWTLQLDFENYFYAGTNASGSFTNDELLILPTVRYIFAEINGARLYGSFGAGMDLEFSNTSDTDWVGTQTTDYTDLAFAAGLQAPLDDSTLLFVEAKYNITFGGYSIASDIPVTAGLGFNY